jgi:hypothetical protein
VAFASVESEDTDGDVTRQELLDRFGKRLFAMTCDEHEDLYTDYTSCIWPRGDPVEFIRKVVREGVSVGCKMPPRRLMESGLEFLETGAADVIMNHPLFNKLPETPCGLCSRRIRCCTRARSFFTQALDSEKCGIDTEPCNIAPLTDDEMAKLSELHPEVEATGRCDYNAFIRANLDSLHKSDLFPFVRRAICQLFDTTRPNIKCISVNDTCKCCCDNSHYDAEKDACVANENVTIDEECIETE